MFGGIYQDEKRFNDNHFLIGGPIKNKVKKINVYIETIEHKDDRTNIIKKLK